MMMESRTVMLAIFSPTDSVDQEISLSTYSLRTSPSIEVYTTSLKVRSTTALKLVVQLQHRSLGLSLTGLKQTPSQMVSLTQPYSPVDHVEPRLRPSLIKVLCNSYSIDLDIYWMKSP
mmetsp:Transcript_6933/g.9846  ORF Transcript_6933/g.9846 Transcript_6933/m.9846 type:complete len:118 (-) Transcript_6933:1190-1543(-)